MCLTLLNFIIGRWALGVRRFLIEHGAGCIDPRSYPCTRSAIVCLVHATSAVSSGARILFFRTLRDWTERRLFYQRQRRPAVRTVVRRAVHRNLGASSHFQPCNNGKRRLWDYFAIKSNGAILCKPSLAFIFPMNSWTPCRCV